MEANKDHIFLLADSMGCNATNKEGKFSAILLYNRKT
jgi:hypothetical protein